MTMTEDERKILAWAESLEERNPALWEKFIQQQIENSRGKIDRLTARMQVIKTRVASCRPNKRIPNSISSKLKWSGFPNENDRDCTRCGVLDTGGRLRYLGYHYIGMEKVCKEIFPSDGGEPYTDDVDTPYYLHCWRCEKCGNEETDDWFL